MYNQYITKKIRLAGLCVTAIAIFGCASTADIKTENAEPNCAHSCSTSYSECLGKFTLFPIQAQHQCTDAMRLCVNACPARKPEPIESK